MWPLEDHVADKIAAMYERHREQLVPSTRFKDLVDLVLIARDSTLDGTITHQALHAEVRRRNAAGTRLVIPAEFAVPDPAWIAGYRAEAAKTKELSAEHRTLEGVTPLAESFHQSSASGTAAARDVAVRLLALGVTAQALRRR